MFKKWNLCFNKYIKIILILILKVLPALSFSLPCEGNFSHSNSEGHMSFEYLKRLDTQELESIANEKKPSLNQMKARFLIALSYSGSERHTKLEELAEEGLFSAKYELYNLNKGPKPNPFLMRASQEGHPEAVDILNDQIRRSVRIARANEAKKRREERMRTLRGQSALFAPHNVPLTSMSRHAEEIGYREIRDQVELYGDQINYDQSEDLIHTDRRLSQEDTINDPKASMRADIRRRGF